MRYRPKLPTVRYQSHPFYLILCIIQLRRSKLLEEERRMLLKGLQSVDKGREWYTKRLAEVADKQRYGAPDTSDQSSTDQQQERINFEQLRINEVFINRMHSSTHILVAYH